MTAPKAYLVLTDVTGRQITARTGVQVRVGDALVDAAQAAMSDGRRAAVVVAQQVADSIGASVRVVRRHVGRRPDDVLDLVRPLAAPLTVPRGSKEQGGRGVVQQLEPAFTHYCPGCRKAVQSEVLGSRLRRAMVRRRRGCATCESRWTTVEVALEDWRYLLALDKKLCELRTVWNQLAEARNS